jgi:hypothetical protein
MLSAVTSQHVGAAPSCADLAKPGLFPNAVVQTRPSWLPMPRPACRPIAK